MEGVEKEATEKEAATAVLLVIFKILTRAGA
jgi:hypothetical protein